MFKHIVCFKLKDKNDAPEVKKRLLSLKGDIPFIKSLEVGIDVLESERSYDIALTVEFENKQDYKQYVIHEKHQIVRKYIHSVRESSIAVDFDN